MKVKIILFLIIYFISFNVYGANIDNVKSAICIDSKSGRVLYEKNGYDKRPMASLTKIMTSIILAEHSSLDTMVDVPDKAVWIGGSELGLMKGDKISVYNLLVGMLLPSGNDCAYTAGIHVGGTIDNFAKLMNNKAKEIGALNTSFANPHGLDNDNHYSTAYDIALIMNYAIKNKTINEIINSKNIVVDINGRKKNVKNTNRLLRTYSYCDGGKTGYTGNADRCLVATASKDNFRIITVVLGATTTDFRFNSAIDIFEDTFNKYNLVDLSKYLSCYIKIPLFKCKDKFYEKNLKDNLIYPLTKEEEKNIYLIQNVKDKIIAPMSLGYKIANISLYLKDNKIYDKDIYLDKVIERMNINDYIISILR